VASFWHTVEWSKVGSHPDDQRSIESSPLIIQSRKESQKPLWIAFVDLQAAFDSVDRIALWKLLSSLGLHSKVVDLV